jgi:hypothetical protein
VRKRGYIVPPHGDVRIEGFRTSLDNVATFRFSSVDGSYAGKKGKTRNVGVIAVAIFEEQAMRRDQEIVTPEEARNTPSPAKNKKDSRYDYTDDLDAGVAAKRSTRGHDVAKAERRTYRPTTGAADKAPAPTVATRPAPQGGYGGGMGRPSQAPPPPSHYDNYREPADEGGEMQKEEGEHTGRLGLGTEFGEQRSSGASYTRFVRSNDRPIAIAELRYNDAAGLVALGIQVQPLPDSGEIMMRETADPFPGDRNFSRRP